jgi:predicted Zn-dependent protease
LTCRAVVCGAGKADVILADDARDAGQWDRAAQLYRQALDRNPDNPPIWVQYGHALKESGELRDPDRLAQAETANKATCRSNRATPTRICS